MRAVLWFAIAALGFPIAAWGSARTADVLAVAIARQAVTLFRSSTPPAHPTEIDQTVHAVVLQREPIAEARLPSLSKLAPVRRGARSRPLAVRGIRISADTVLRLVESGARPNGVRVAASGSRPAGLLLSGVGRLSIGLRDGDVLTHAGGRPATSVADVVGVVIASRGRRVTEISGRFWRDGEPWDLIVEQPYLERPAAGSR